MLAVLTVPIVVKLCYSQLRHNYATNFYSAMLCICVDFAVERCLSIRLSVTRRYSVETTKHVLRLLC